MSPTAGSRLSVAASGCVTLGLEVEFGYGLDIIGG